MKNKTLYAVKVMGAGFLTDQWSEPMLFIKKRDAKLLLSGGRKIVRVELREIKPKAKMKNKIEEGR